MTFKFANVATATLASSLSSSATTLTVATGLGALFPALLAGQKYAAVLVDSSNNYEFVAVTARAGDVMTILRAQESTTARAFSSGSRVELRLTAAALANFAQLDTVQTFTEKQTFSGNAEFNGSTVFNGPLTANGGVLNGSWTGSPEFSGNPIFSGIPAFSNGAQFSNSLVATSLSTVWFQGQFRAAGVRVGSNEALVYESATNALGVRVGPSSAYKYFNFQSDGDFATPGNITASGDITAFSDERLKTDWMPLQANFVEQLAQVRSGSFLRTDIGKFQIGVGAQSLQQIMPYAIHQENDGYLSVNYGAAAMVSCVELAKEVVGLKEQIAALKGQ